MYVYVGFKRSTSTIRNVTKTYGNGITACADISVSINKGEFVFVIGLTASGKSTFVKMLYREERPTKGTVMVGGVNVRDYDLDVIRNNVSVVLQKNVLFSGTIADNLRWGDEKATLKQIVEACDIAQAREFVESFPDGHDPYIEEGFCSILAGHGKAAKDNPADKNAPYTFMKSVAGNLASLNGNFGTFKTSYDKKLSQDYQAALDDGKTDEFVSGLRARCCHSCIRL